MRKSYDATEFFGLGYLVGGISSPETVAAGTMSKRAPKKGDKTSKNVGEAAARNQTMNPTNRMRKSRGENG